MEAKQRPETRRQGSLSDLVARYPRHGRSWLQNLLSATVACPRSSPGSCRPSLMAMIATLALVRWPRESAGLGGGRVWGACDWCRSQKITTPKASKDPCIHSSMLRQDPNPCLPGRRCAAPTAPASVNTSSVEKNAEGPWGGGRDQQTTRVAHNPGGATQSCLCQLYCGSDARRIASQTASPLHRQSMTDSQYSACRGWLLPRLHSSQ